jgi:hypothetical protein
MDKLIGFVWFEISGSSEEELSNTGYDTDLQPPESYRNRKMLMIRGVGGARKAILILACIIAPFLFIFLFIRHGGSDGPSCQIYASREVSCP